MPDYKEMYLQMFKATEQTINILREAQQACEEIYISSLEPEWAVVTLPTKKHKDASKE